MLKWICGFYLSLAVVILFSFRTSPRVNSYAVFYAKKMNALKANEVTLWQTIKTSSLSSNQDKIEIQNKLKEARYAMKAADFWLRYLDPLAYKKINGPLPVEWETEVFEKSEKPYKRLGAGLALASLCLAEDAIQKDTLLQLVSASIEVMPIYLADSTTGTLNSFQHAFLCNRLFLLNLATLYTTGFECPNKEEVIPELLVALKSVNEIYAEFNRDFPSTPFAQEYLAQYAKCIEFVESQPKSPGLFDHYTFIRDFINPLFAKNQELIKKYRIVSHSLVDYTLNNDATAIFSKNLYKGQNEKGIYSRVNDPYVLAEIDRIGKLLFYDPILSGNNRRSCASCHKSGEFFTDTVAKTALQYDGVHSLLRNTPSLINANFNHLLMLDGMHFTLQRQTKAVVLNRLEMGGTEKDILTKILSCKEYKESLTKLAKYTPWEPKINMDHIASAITLYYSKFSKGLAPFDDAMNKNAEIDKPAIDGFNLFMGKAQCATCHFLPLFNGVKPPYVNSEFEVLGVPDDSLYRTFGADSGRYIINSAYETMHAFRTGTLRNTAKTKPYMHNGVFQNLMQVVDFYNVGGGVGKKLRVENQTLASDSLNLTGAEKQKLIAFMHTLNESIPFEAPPANLPKSKRKNLQWRKVGGEY